MPNKLILLLLFTLISLLVFAGVNPAEKTFLKPLTNDDYNFIAINEIKMWVSNNGDGSYDHTANSCGFYWPSGILAKKTAIFDDGLFWSCIAGTDTLVNGNSRFQGLQAGRILPDGTADDPNDSRYRIYKIQKYWEELQPGPERENLERDYKEWPVKDGAPWIDVDGDGIFDREVDQPDFIGDQVLWYVANDLDDKRLIEPFSSSSIGLEFQTTVFGFYSTNFLKDVVFKKYLIINKSDIRLDSMYIGYWSDDDLGNADDDYAGCDTLLNLGYTYNANNQDGTGSGITYGSAPPAVGHMFVQGPVVSASASDSAHYRNKWIRGSKNRNMNGFMLFLYYSWFEPWPPEFDYMYNYLQGFLWNGNPITNPLTGLPTKYAVPGNPVTGDGWYEGAGWPGGPAPNDYRQLISSGPFTMAPGDSQEITIAILIARGSDNLNSVAELRKKSGLVQTAYQINFKNTPVMETPLVKAVPLDRGVELYWDTKVEDFNKPDPYLVAQGVPNPNYQFEGYRIWQFRDVDSAEPKLLATFDKKNTIDIIYKWEQTNGYPAQVVAIDGPNEGLRRSFSITENIYDEKPLNNGNPYYFAVTAYAYSALSDPTFTESNPQIIEVIPGLQAIDQKNIYESADNITADHITGDGDGNVKLIVVDPEALTGDEYRVIFEGEEKVNAYSFINYTKKDTIISDCTDFAIDTTGAIIIDGFKLSVHNEGLEQINPLKNSRVKEVAELKGPGGFDLDEPRDVFEHFNSTGDWEITSYGHESELLQNINIEDKYAIGYHNYEIRFNSTGSQYYTTGSQFSFFPWARDDSLADERVPFEIWDMGRSGTDEDDQRLVIKTLDDYASMRIDSIRVDRNGQWSQLANGDWEPIFAYLPDSPYQEPLPLTSGSLRDHRVFKFGKVIIRGNLPAEGTVIGIIPWKPLSSNDVFSVTATAPDTKNYASAKANLDDISVFPNPFSGFSNLSGYIKQDFMRFTNLPTQCTVRIFSLAGVFVRRIEKNDDNPWLDWDLKNNTGRIVGSGVYIAHIEMPHIGEKVMKLAIILENQP